MGVDLISVFGYGFFIPFKNQYYPELNTTDFEQLELFIEELNILNSTNITAHIEGHYKSDQVFICSGGFRNYCNSYKSYSSDNTCTEKQTITFEVTDKDIAVLQVIADKFSPTIRVDMRWNSFNYQN
jgi:hypothetical protein